MADLVISLLHKAAFVKFYQFNISFEFELEMAL